MEEKYKVGDKVRVKSDLKSNTWHNSVLVNRTMAKSRNEILTIEKIVGNKEYRVVENQWLWGEDMFEPVEEETITLDDLKEYKKEHDKYDVINKAEHYNQGIEVIDIIESYNLDFSTANIIKYVLRAKYKGNYIQDLLKAKYYLERLINNYERDTNKENR